MAKTTKPKNPKSKTSWLRLTLELILVFIRVSAGFLFDNFREERSNQKMEFVHTLDSLNRDLNNSLEAVLTLE